MAQTENKSGRIIRSTLIRMYPGSFLYAIMFTFMFVIDSIIAGNALGEEALAAVAFGLPGYGAFLALMAAIVHGTGLRVTWAKGRADHPGFQRAFMGGLVFAGLAGIVFMAVILIFSAPIAKVFGGAKATEEIYQYSLLYLRCCATMVFLSAISGALRENIGVIGYQTERAVLGVVLVYRSLDYCTEEFCSEDSSSMDSWPESWLADSCSEDPCGIMNRTTPITSMNIDMNWEVDNTPTVPLWSALKNSITVLPMLYIIRYNAPVLPAGRSLVEYMKNIAAIMNRQALDISCVGISGTPFGAYCEWVNVTLIHVSASMP